MLFALDDLSEFSGSARLPSVFDGKSVNESLKFLYMYDKLVGRLKVYVRGNMLCNGLQKYVGFVMVLKSKIIHGYLINFLEKYIAYKIRN